MRRSLNRNHYFVLGFLIGLILSFYVPEDIWNLVQDDCPQTTESFIDKFADEFEPHLNIVHKPVVPNKPAKSVIRPRYYSSELGIKEKLFIGVMTSQENINTLATAFNLTTAHLINKIKFFINADNNVIKTNFKLKNIVGFTDNRENLRPFHIIKYIGDNYLDDYDYFLLIKDTCYVDGKKLMELLYHISVTFDIYMGKRYQINELNGLNDETYHKNDNNNKDNDDGDNNEDINNDRNYCDLDSGIILSSSVIRKIRNNLDWCVRNAITNYHSINIGKCVKYSSKVSGCQERFQEINIKSYKIDNMKLYKDLGRLQYDLNFRNSTIIYPITNPDDFYILHAHFAKIHLEVLRNQSIELEQKTYRIANGTISNDVLEIRWPLGVPPSSIPKSRHDIILWQFINTTHLLMPNHESNLEQLNQNDYIDFQKILNTTLKYAKSKYPNFEYKSIHTAYRRFDPNRGIDYQIHLNLMNSKNGKIHVKSFEVVKPLGRVEIIPSPYVTESTRISILLPIFEHQLNEALEFIKRYEKICMENQDNTFLMMTFLYRYDSSSKDDADPFKNLKTLALNLSKKFKTDGSKIAWVSIRLPQIFSHPSLPDDIMLNSMFARHEILSLAVVDLSLRKIGLESLILLVSNSMYFKADFLNRVRMNTIQGFQIFSPIGFMMYPCNFVNFCKECESCDVSQATGYFDRFNYDVLSFYSRDYVEARKKLENLVPIVRNDNDIENLLNRNDRSINNVIDMFIKARLKIHILRGIEPNLRFGLAIKNFINSHGRDNIPKCPAFKLNSYEFEQQQQQLQQQNDNSLNSSLKYNNFFSDKILLSSNKCIHLASRKQIGDAIVRYEDKQQKQNEQIQN